MACRAVPCATHQRLNTLMHRLGVDESMHQRIGWVSRPMCRTAGRVSRVASTCLTTATAPCSGTLSCISHALQGVTHQANGATSCLGKLDSPHARAHDTFVSRVTLSRATRHVPRTANKTEPITRNDTFMTFINFHLLSFAFICFHNFAGNFLSIS